MDSLLDPKQAQNHKAGVHHVCIIYGFPLLIATILSIKPIIHLLHHV